MGTRDGIISQSWMKRFAGIQWLEREMLGGMDLEKDTLRGSGGVELFDDGFRRCCEGHSGCDWL